MRIAHIIFWYLYAAKRGKKLASPPSFTVKRSFMARNIGEVPINIRGFYINHLLCEGYGFSVLKCEPFVLEPNGTQKIEIGFTPDFTLSRVEQNFFIHTDIIGDDDEGNGMIKFALLTTIPAHLLDSCAAFISRPTWESALRWTGFGLTTVLLLCVLASAFLEADRILRGALIGQVSRSSPTQPPLDLRLLSKSSTVEEKTKVVANKNKYLIDATPDWGLMNVKQRNKDKESFQKGIRIPDWTNEDERRYGDIFEILLKS